MITLRRWFARGALLALIVIAIGAAAGEPLVSLKTGSLGPLPIGTTRLLSVGDQLVAMGAAGLAVRDPKTGAWSRREWQFEGRIVAVTRDAQDGFLVLSDGAEGPARQVVKVSVAAAGPTVALPLLPSALLVARAGTLKGMLYVAGTTPDGSPRVFAIDTTLHDQWRTLPPWPAAGDVTSLVGQNSALFLTVKPGGEGGRERLLRATPGQEWTDQAEVSGTIVEGSARPMGQAHVIYLVRVGNAMRVIMLHTITGSWAVLGEMQVPDARMATAWRDGIAWVSYGPNASTNDIAYAEIESGRLLLKSFDWIIIAGYLVSMLGLGLYFYMRERRNSTSDFFVGGRTIPFWAAGISLYAANTSSISYIAIPAKAFETNWQYLTNNLIGVLGLIFVAIWIVPLLRRLELMSVFHYLETRFHPLIRTLASALYMAVQIGSRMSVILFLPSLAIATITGIDVAWSILIMGVFTMIYTAMGGMKAVVWTDFLQLIVKMGGIAFAIGFIILALDGGAAALFKIANAEHKMKLFDWSFDLTKASVWGFIFLVFFDVVLTFPKDQVLMQRVLSTKNSKDATRSVLTFAAVTIPGGFMFYFVGTALYAFYKTHPERMNPLLSIDATFPLFIAAELPAGIRGLIIAGILAAAMATLSSIMNSVATLATVDFYEKIVKRPNPKTSVRFAEGMTVLAGVLGMSVALILSRYDIHSVFDISIELFGVLGGGFAGVYTLGMFTRRANWQGVTIGVAASIMLTLVAWFNSLVHPYFYLAISILLCIVIGYCASWLFPARTRESLRGLTIHDPVERSA
ncbi:MAG: sodium:solute symporter [Pseudomonadota bacterium]|nr:sodium:solute symporter [Pseudomonadota bacterium]